MILIDLDGPSHRHSHIVAAVKRGEDSRTEETALTHHRLRISWDQLGLLSCTNKALSAARKVSFVAARDEVRCVLSHGAWCASTSTGQGARARRQPHQNCECPFARDGKVRQALLHGLTAHAATTTGSSGRQGAAGTAARPDCARGHHHRQLLTNLERIRVADWALRSAVGG